MFIDFFYLHMVTFLSRPLIIMMGVGLLGELREKKYGEIKQ